MREELTTWQVVFDRALGGFRYLENVRPSWLETPDGRRLLVNRLYLELGLAFVFDDQPLEDRALLQGLCRPANVGLVACDPHGSPSANDVADVCDLLGRAMRLLARAPGEQEAKRELLPRISAARAECVRMRGMVVLQAHTEAVTERPDRQGLLRQERIRQQLLVNWRRFRGAWLLFSQSRLALVGLGLIILFAVMAVLHPILRASAWQAEMYNPKTGFDFLTAPHPSPPSWLPQPENPYHQVSFAHILGTDTLGHDVLSVLLAATQPAFLIGITAAVSTALASTTMGAMAAYFGGVVNTLCMQIADVFLLLPAPLFMIIFGVVFQDVGPVGYGLTYGLVAGLGGAAIVMRSYAFTLVNKPYIEASRIAGGGHVHIMVRHMLPHMLPLAALYMMISVVGAVVADGFISFFGFNRSYINWGNIIYSSFTYRVINSQVAWHVLVPASLALSLFAAAFYLVARGLHQVADPRLRGR